MSKQSIVWVLTVVALAGCSHATMRGNVAMKTGADEAHVCLGNNEVKTGDRVEFFKNVCAPKGSKTYPSAAACEKQALGGGVVTQTLNEHYSVVKVDPGVQFDEGTLVEKK